MADLKQFKLPDVGEGLTEAEIVSWKVKPGDHVAINDVIVEIETAKSLVELPSPYAGVISELMVLEGETVAVGTVIIAVDTDPSGTPAPVADAGTAGTTAQSGTAVTDLVPEIARPAEGEPVEPGLSGGPAPGGRTSVLVGYGPRETSAKRRPRKAGSPPSVGAPAAPTIPVSLDIPTSPAAPVSLHPAASRATGGATNPTVLAKPPVRKLAKNLGVDLSTVAPTGPGGTVTRADIEAAAAGGSVASGAASATLRVTADSAADREVRVPVRGVRKMTAQAMVDSAFSAPHVTVFTTIDVTRTVKLVERLKVHKDFRDVKVSALLVLAKAMLIAVRRTPELNSSWDEAAQEIVVKRYVNLGIAAATPRGLVVPNIKDADAMSLRALAEALGSLVSTAREGRTAPADMQRGTITITNVGVFGVDTGTPIINPGESAILAFGAIREQPWVVRGKVRPRHVTTLALSFDHRVVDGEQGATFLADVAAILTDPSLSLAMG